MRLSGGGFFAAFDWTSRRGTVASPLNLTPIDLLLKVIYMQLLLRERACFIHGCAVEREGRGYLFFGPSGSGKSTLARTAGGAVLADELVIVKRGVERRPSYSLYGTPFWGGLNRRAPLTGLFALRFHPDASSLAPLSRVQALRRLLPCLGGFGAPRSDDARLFEWASILVRDQRCHEICRSVRSEPWDWFYAVAA
ncbi:MAG: hypothetical protein AB1515_00180 [Nitrospirota bacterium]